MQHTQLIARYFDDMKGSDLKEAPRRDKFLVLLQALFPSSAEELRRYTDGIETPVSMPVSGAQFIRKGSIDAYYGDLVIEFERSLPSKRAEAEDQLRSFGGAWGIGIKGGCEGFSRRHNRGHTRHLPPTCARSGGRSTEGD